MRNQTTERQLNLLRDRGKQYAYALAKLMQESQLGGRVVPVGVGSRFVTIGIEQASPMAKLDTVFPKLANQLAYKVKADHVISSRTQGRINYQVQLQKSDWSDITRQMITGWGMSADTIGVGENFSSIPFRLDDGAPHALIAGTTGAGKSVAVAGAMYSLCASYTPEEMQLAVCDPHNDYEAFSGSAHLAMPVAVEPQAIERVITRVYYEFLDRTEKKDRSRSSMILVIDEAESEQALSHDRNLTMVKQIASGGRKYKIHLVVASQEPKKTRLPDLLPNLNNRFVGQVTDAATSALLTGRPGQQAHLLTGKGDFLHIQQHTPVRFQVAMLESRDYDLLPRGEIMTPMAEPPAEGRLATESELDLERLVSDGPGRPKLELDPKLVALYLMLQNDISFRKAGNWGITQTNHKLHRDFVKKVLAHMGTIENKGYLK